MSERFSSGTINTKQTTKKTDLSIKYFMAPCPLQFKDISEQSYSLFDADTFAIVMHYL